MSSTDEIIDIGAYTIYEKLVICICTVYTFGDNRIGGVMVSVLASNAIDRNIRLYRIRKDIIKTDIFHSFFYGDLVQIIYMFKSEISRLIAYIRVFIVYVYCGKPQTASVV
jgi:hypothetical protein